MSTPELLRLAAGWWGSRGGDDDYAHVDDILFNRADEVPGLLKALVQTAPPGQLHRIGTGPVETLEMAIEFGWRKEPATLELVSAAGLTATEIFDVLKGAYPDYILQMDVGRWLEGTLTSEQIEWLSSADAPGRRNWL